MSTTIETGRTETPVPLALTISGGSGGIAERSPTTETAAFFEGLQKAFVTVTFADGVILTWAGASFTAIKRWS